MNRAEIRERLLQIIPAYESSRPENLAALNTLALLEIADELAALRQAMWAERYETLLAELRPERMKEGK